MANYRDTVLRNLNVHLGQLSTLALDCTERLQAVFRNVVVGTSSMTTYFPSREERCLVSFVRELWDAENKESEHEDDGEEGEDDEDNSDRGELEGEQREEEDHSGDDDPGEERKKIHVHLEWVTVGEEMCEMMETNEPFILDYCLR